MAVHSFFDRNKTIEECNLATNRCKSADSQPDSLTSIEFIDAINFL